MDRLASLNGDVMMGVPQQCWLSVFQGEARVEKGVWSQLEQRCAG